MQFGILSADEVRRMSVVELDETSMYHRGAPTPKGALDHRMGTVDRRLNCGTCELDVRSCSGHFGHIELPLPIYHSAFLETVRKVLNCICYSCSRLRFSQEEMSEYELDPNAVAIHKKQRLSAIYTTCRFRRRCPHCNSPCPIFVRLNALMLQTDWSNVDDSAFESPEEKAYLTHATNPTMVRELLVNMADEDVAWLGFDPKNSHPREMVLTVLAVPPPVLRPSVMVTEGSRARGQDDLTIKLGEILKRRHALVKALKGMPTSDHITDPVVLDLWEKLTQDIGVYFHNNPRLNKLSTQRSGVPTKCLFGRLKGKQGRFRMNLQGKRVNYSGRTVISPDPLLDVDEVGVPVSMAVQLTIQELVTPENIGTLSQRVHIGSGHITGAESIITPDGTNIQLEYCQNRDKLLIQEGWIVERPLQDGDYVIFNRQPTLHRCSMMGHRVVVMHRGDTFRVNLAVVGPYNADFDGDEMNLHVPQSPLATSEVRGLMSVVEQCVSPQAGRPVIGLVQDALLGGYLMSSIDTLVARSTFMQTIAAARRRDQGLDKRTQLPPPPFAYPEPLWTGKQLLEVVLPPITVENPKEVNQLWDTSTDDGSMAKIAAHPLVIRDGRILCGQLNKARLGVAPGSIMHHCLLALGNQVAVSVMGDLQRMINRWLLERGFSIGIGDCVPSEGVDAQMRQGICTVMTRVDTLQSEIPRWSSLTLGGASDEGRRGLEEIAVESTIHRMVNKVQMSTGSLVRSEMTTKNGLGCMVTAGSKGNSINICQIMLCVGQNCVNGARLAPNGEDDRTLPSYARGDRSMDGLGFVSNSYILGLNARETFHHAKGGREGLVDTAVKTSKTGYLQRRMIKAMESHRVDHDLTVRDAYNNIVEFVYGGDGLNPVKMERMPIRAYTMGDDELRKRFVTDEQCHDLQEKELQRMLETRDEVRENRIHLMNQTTETWVTGSVDPRRVMQLVTSTAHTAGDDTVRHEQVVVDIETLVARLTDEAAFLPFTSANLRLSLLFELRTAVVVERVGTSCKQWAKIIAMLHDTISQSFAEAGEMVGCIAAQSIGEPATQLTLNSFHLSGVAQNGVGQLSGIPRIAEIIDGTKVIKTARMLMPLVDANGPYEALEVYARSLEHCTLTKLITSYEMEVMPPNCCDTYYSNDSLFLAMHAMCNPEKSPVARSCMRLVLNRRLLSRRGMTPANVVQRLHLCYPEQLRVVASPASATDWVLRVWVQGTHSDEAAAAFFSQMMKNTVIGGTAGIQLAELREVPQVVVSPGRALSVQQEIVIETAGTDLAEMMWQPDICWERITTNSIVNVFEVLGISAARVLIFHELRQLIAGDSNKVNDRHLMMVANCMTQNGVIMSLSRHGINRIAETGPLMRSSFEETSEVLTDAGVFCERDTVQGVSQSIMLGKTPFVGTGCSQVLRPTKTTTASMHTGGDVNVLQACCQRRVGQSRFRGHTREPQQTRPPREDVDTLFASESDDSRFRRHLTEGLPHQDVSWLGLWEHEGIDNNLSDMFGEELFAEHLVSDAEATEQQENADSARDQELVEVVSRMPYRVPPSP